MCHWFREVLDGSDGMMPWGRHAGSFLFGLMLGNVTIVGPQVSEELLTSHHGETKGVVVHGLDVDW